MNISARHITQTLEVRLNSLANKPPIKWPQVDFSNPNAELYLQPFVLRGANDLLALNGGLSNSVGVYQVNVVAPRDSGAKPAELQADAIAEHFAAQRKLSGLDITDIAINAAVVGDTTYTVPVSITYSVTGKY